MPNEISPAELLYIDILKDEYLNEIYSNILFNYSIKLFNLNDELKDININDALQFADILSKSENNEDSDKHKLLAQEIVSLLKKLYPDDKLIEYYFGSVLANIGNFAGQSQFANSFKSIDYIENVSNEVNKEIMTIPNEDNKYFFFSQKNVFDSIEKTKYYSFSGPTSMGKSFIMQIFIKSHLINDTKENFAIIVPSKALIHELSLKIINTCGELLKNKNYKVVTSANSALTDTDSNFIFILTPERLLYLLMEKEKIRIDHIFLDEAQKISELDKRSTFYFQIVDLIQEKNINTKITFASPNIPNPDLYLKTISLYKNSTIGAYHSSFSPVTQYKYIFDFNTRKIHLYNSLSDSFEDITSFPNINGMLEYIKTYKSDSKNLVYYSGKANALNDALAYAAMMPYKDKNKYPELYKFADELEEEIHPNYFLIDIIKKGIAYHIGFLPINIRNKIESLYSSNDIDIIFCTSTLKEGVNLHADNLFITSNCNGKHELSQIDLRNLIGRVGRIDTSLSGNVYFMVNDESNDKLAKKYMKLIQDTIPIQELSIDKNITNEQMEYIISLLKKGETQIEKNTLTKGNYDYLRNIITKLLSDITKDRNSLLKQKFSEVLKEKDINAIKEIFKERSSNIDDDITVTLDQVEKVQEGIENNLRYPKFNGSIKYNDLYPFLVELGNHFKWDLYESHDIGYKNDNGEYSKLKHYATVLNLWMNGFSIQQMIENAVNYNSSTSVDVSAINDKITNLLDEIQNIILFKFSNYFSRFTNELKKKNITIDYDWYDFVEYGSCNYIIITLQRLGFTRETAISIYRLDSKYDFYYIKNKEIRLKKNLLNCPIESIATEAKQLYYNLYEIFE